MLLDDISATSRALARLEPKLYLKSDSILQSVLDNTISYAIDDAVIIASTHLTVTKPSNLLSNLEFARRPHKNLWYEFAAKPRTDGLRDGGINPVGLQPSRIGLLITDHPNFPNNTLAGRALISWRHQHAKVDECNICYSDLLWDFRPEWLEWRDKTALANERIMSFGQDRKKNRSISYLYRNQSKELDAHVELLGHFKPISAWYFNPLYHYMGGKSHLLEKFSESVEASFSDAFSEAGTLLAILLLFNTSNALIHNPINLTTINKHRQKSSKPLLRKYNQTIFRVNRQSNTRISTGPVQHGVVLQKVKGHFKSRTLKDGTRKVFWIDEYSRGDSIYGIGPSVANTRRMAT